MTDMSQSSPWGGQGSAAALGAADAAVAAAQTSVPPVAPAPSPWQPFWFSGLAWPFTRLLAVGFLLQIVTLGIYRFWLITNVRRFNWSHTGVTTDGLTYTGTGLELFKGFLIALAVIVPLKILSFLIVLGLPHAEWIVSIGLFIIYLFLAQYAIYAGRRYRLTRTSWRGLRARMTGSPWAYAVKAFGWSLFVILTLGLAYPWAAASLERIKMRETAYGDAQGDFVGEPFVLFKRGLWIWLVGIGGPIAIIIAVLSSLPPGVLTNVFAAGMAGRPPIPSQAMAVGLAIATASSSLLIPLLLFPAFQAVVFRWRMDGTRLGGAVLGSQFTIGKSYRVYVLGFLAIMGASMVAGIAFALIVGLGAVVAGGIGALLAGSAGANSMFATLVIGFFAVVGYVLLLGAYWMMKIIFIDLRLLRARISTLWVYNLASLEAVAARNVDASAFGDSLGDAVDVGLAL